MSKEELQAKAERVRKVIDGIRELRRQQDELFADLLFQCQLWDMGIDPEQVQGYTCTMGLLSKHKVADNYHALVDIVIMKDGTQQRVKPFHIRLRKS